MIMRLDKYLKTARILKRREAAKELALAGRIWVNDRIAKPSTEINRRSNSFAFWITYSGNKSNRYSKTSI